MASKSSKCKRPDTAASTLASPQSALHLLLKINVTHHDAIEAHIQGEAYLTATGGVQVLVINQDLSSGSPEPANEQESEGSPVAWITAQLMTRRPGFLETCEAYSQELADCCLALFDARGRLEGAPLQNQVAASARTDGALLYIEKVEVVKAHRGNDIGAMCMHALLQALVGRWTLAIIFPALEVLPPGTDFQTVVTKLSRYFARAGFRQCHGDAPHALNKYWWLEAGHVPPGVLARAATTELTVHCRHAISRPTGLEHEIIDAMNASPTDLLSVRSTLLAIVGRGGSLDSARALHVAVANKYKELLPVLVSLGASINLADEQGYTPLHLAAIAAAISSDTDVTAVSVATLLLALGANKTALSLDGETPAQHLASELGRMKKFCKTITGQEYPMPPSAVACLALLK